MLHTACKPFKELGTTGASFLSSSNRQQENEKVSVPVETKANSLAPDAEAYTLEKSWKENVTSNSWDYRGRMMENTSWLTENSVMSIISPNIRQSTIFLKIILPGLDPERNRQFSLCRRQRTISFHWGSKPELLCYFCEYQWHQISEAMNKW